jgi:methionyl aminopeptidase
LHIGALYTITTILYKEKSTKFDDFSCFTYKNKQIIKYTNNSDDYFSISTHAIDFRLVTIAGIKLKRIAMSVNLRTPEQIAKMRIAGKLAAEVLELIGDYVVAGASTEDLDRICHDHIVHKQKAIPACLGYRGFPKSICTSVNQVVCHGIPSEKKILKKGDIINIDVTVIKDGWYGDTSKMYIVGDAPEHAKRLIKVSQECLYKGIEMVRPGVRLGDIGHAIQTHAEAHYYSVVRDYCGHGIGDEFHQEPQILHYGKPGTGLELKEGMTFTIEPMVNAGRYQTKLKRDGWTVETKDGRLSSQWEHTMLVTHDGVEVFTARQEENF